MSDPSLYYLPDGRHICQICCEIKTRDELEPVSDEALAFYDEIGAGVWDVCRDCAARERQAGAIY